MGTFNRKGEGSITYAYEYEGDINVNGNYTQNATTGQLTAIGGTVLEGTAIVGNFTGSLRGGSMRYTVSELPSGMGALVFAAIEEIERAITSGNDDNTEES